MTLAVVLLVMMAGGIFWYWQSLPKRAPVKKNRQTADSNNALRKPHAKKSMPALTPAEATTNKYRAVSIHCKENGCSAAKALVGTRFLTHAAPQIPLPECDQPSCQCSYARHDDQRTDNDDRRSVHSLRTELYTRTAEQERREKKGRRRSDVG